MKKQDERVISAIRHDLLCEMHRYEDVLLDSLKTQVTRLEFSAAKYKDRESYDQLLKMKNAFNIMKCYFKVTRENGCDV